MRFFFDFGFRSYLLCPVIICFAGAHLFKFIRFYLVLLEEKKLSFFDVLFLYVRTTFVNLIIPFKLGEIYRIAAVKNMTGMYKTGILLVVIDRFFDTLALLTLTLPFEILFMKGADPVLTVLLAGIVFLFFCYFFFTSTYRYLNKYLITKKRSKRSMALLNALDIANSWYLFLRKLIRGRSPLVFLSSLLGWGMEFLALKAFAGTFGTEFDLGAFIRYINSLLSGEKSRLGSAYNMMGTAIFLILTIVFVIIWSSEKKGKDKGRSSVRV